MAKVKERERIAVARYSSEVRSEIPASPFQLATGGSSRVTLDWHSSCRSIAPRDVWMVAFQMGRS